MCFPVQSASGSTSPNITSPGMQPQFASMRNTPMPPPQATKDPVPNPNGGYDIDDGKSIWTVPHKNSPIGDWVSVRQSGTAPPEKPKKKEAPEPSWLEKGADLIGGLRDPNPNAYRK